ncbi:GH92 family glycosyl hydrolase [Kribbella sp. NPDC005582]|uniref:GH92 family glycosyl hydrolase n=1 Tax=Kribbella sp. NPDC005582 TaxID=3156893 RepID=UPI0033B5CF0A
MFVRALAFALVVAVAPPIVQAAPQVSDPAQYVNPLVGTKDGGPDFGDGGGRANTYPGAVAPFGMLQWSPDTVTSTQSGYAYADNQIKGFSLTHLSGAGCINFQNIPIMPVLGNAPVASSRFSHANEAAAPGAYAVTFDNGLRTELTATQRSGAARFTYPAGQQASLSVDAGKSGTGGTGAVTVGTDTISGWADSGGFCFASTQYRVYFHLSFDRPFSSVNTTGASAFVSFDTTTNRTVEAKAAVSFVSLDGAKANLAAETGTRSFDAVRDGTRADWNALLGRIDVGGGTDSQLKTFYTALYHSLLHPNVFGDVDGKYVGMDKEVHTAPAGHTQYANFSGWDIYRSQIALLGLIAPGQATDIAQSAVNQAAQSGYYDRWTYANSGTQVMNGDPMPVIVSTLYAFGATAFDANDGWWRMVVGADHPKQRPGHEQYNAIGYVPYNQPNVSWPTATTLEYGVADFAVAQLAARLGHKPEAEKFLRRSQGWRNLHINGIIQPRNADLSFPPFSPEMEDSYVEGNAAQYTWMVPHNYRGLFDMMGGDAAVNSRLDNFFSELNAGPHKAFAYLGNEPSANIPWAYAYAGTPYKTQDVVRRALTSLYKPTPDGLVGNDDLGQMSSWAVWAALGLYPQVPGRSELVLASPQFSTIRIDRGNGKTITINAPNASDSVKYVQSLRVNGQASTRAWLTEDFVATGGTLDYTLGATPNTAWGSAAADAPPSFDVGPAQPRTSTAVKGVAGKCLDARGGEPTLAAPVALWDCNATINQTWTLASDGTMRARGHCLDVSSSSRDNGAKIQLWSCNGSGAQQWWPRPGGVLMNPPSGRCLDVPGGKPDSGVQLQLYDCNGSAAQNWALP